MALRAAGDAGEADRGRGSDQRHVAVIGRGAAGEHGGRLANRVDLRRHARLRRAQLLLQGFCERVLLFGPLGHADQLDVLLHQFGEQLVVMRLVEGGQDADAGQFGVRRQRRPFRAIEDPLEKPEETLVRTAHDIPYARAVGDDVRRLAAIDDHVVHPRGEVQVLAEVVRGDVGDFDGVQRAAAGPRGAARVRRFPVEREDGGVHRGARHPVGAREARAGVVVDHRVDVLEQTRPDHVRPADPDLLGR